MPNVSKVRNQGQAPTSLEQIFHDLIESETSTRKRQNLEIVWQALNELHAEEAPDYSISRVGRRVQELGGPRTQSLRNERGEHFRRLIEAFATSVGFPSRKTPLRARTQVEAAISQIPDLGAQTVLKMVMEENRRLKTENDTLRRAYKELSVGISVSEHRSSESLEPTPALARSEGQPLDGAMIDSFVRFMSERWMGERGLCIDPDGSIVDASAGGSLIAPPAFADGLRCVIANARS